MKWDMEPVEIPGYEEYEVDVVGESHYQNALDNICGGKTEDGHEKIVQANLIYEDDNLYDNKAVRVDIEGKTVGYLQRDHARQLRKQMRQKGLRPSKIECSAMIVGGWDRGEDDTGHYGVMLDVPFNP